MLISSTATLFTLLLLIPSTFFNVADASELQFPSTKALPISGADKSGEEDWKNIHGVVSWDRTRNNLSRSSRRSVAEEITADSAVDSSSSSNSSSALILAAERTRRKDPLDGFKIYTGGWNYSNKHYWASVGYTSAPFFVIAGVWFVVFAFCLWVICCYHCCCRRGEPFGYSKVAYALSLILLVLFTIAAIVGCVVLYTGQGRFHRVTTRTLKYLINEADETVSKLRNVSDSLAAAKQIGVDQVFLPSNVQSDIDRIETKINSSASTLSDAAVDNAQNIQDVLDSVRMSLIVIAAVMLFLTFLGFLFSLCGMQACVYTLVVLGWVLVTGTFILCGVFLLLHNVTSDTCVAMNEWAMNPTSHTAIDDLLPCVDNATSQATLMSTKEVTYQLVEVVNQVITNVSNINFSPNFKPLYFNQSGPLVPILCNPFHPDFTNRTCSSGEVDLANATQVWSGYVCQVDSSGICTTTGRLTPDKYRQMSATVSVSLGLYNYGPFLVDLEDCTFVRDTLTVVQGTYCPHLRLYSKWVYSGLVIVSAAVMLSLILWVIYGRERRHRAYTKHVLRQEEHHGKPHVNPFS